MAITKKKIKLKAFKYYKLKLSIRVLSFSSLSKYT